MGGWLLELTRQLDKLRFIASGGVLKDILRERDKETNEDLLLRENSDGESTEAVKLFFDWRRPVRRYKRSEMAKATESSRNAGAKRSEERRAGKEWRSG